MRLSVYSDYALRVLMHAAARHPERVTIDEIAAAFAISRNHLVKVVQHLGQLGYLRTKRGVGGGFELGLDPSEIGLKRLIQETETSTALVECFEGAGGVCRLDSVCRLKGVLHEALEAFFGVLDQYTLADLTNRPRTLKKALGL